MNAGEARDYLEEILPYEGTELGDIWERLIYLYDCSHGIGDEFNAAVKKEIIEQAEWTKESFDLIEIEVVETHKVKRLVEKIRTWPLEMTNEHDIKL